MVKSRYNDFRDLDIWQRCKNIRVRIWEICKGISSKEKYRLCDQMIRSSRSATACIAEGFGRFYYQENIQFCRQARGSLYELLDHIIVAEECGYIGNEKTDSIIDEIKTSIRILNGYVKYLQKRKQME